MHGCSSKIQRVVTGSKSHMKVFAEVSRARNSKKIAVVQRTSDLKRSVVLELLRWSLVLLSQISMMRE